MPGIGLRNRGRTEGDAEALSLRDPQAEIPNRRFGTRSATYLGQQDGGRR